MKRLVENIGRVIGGFANSSASFDVSAQGLQLNETETAKSARPSYFIEETSCISAIIDSLLVKTSLRRITDHYFSQKADNLLASSSLVTLSTHSTLYQVLLKCCHALSYDDIPAVYVTSSLRGINALSMEVKGLKFILLSRMATIALSEPELSFVLGHELGHHQQGNLAGHIVNGLLESLADTSEVLGLLVSETIEVPLKRWCRQSEFNADRAGYICCPDMDSIISLFSKIYDIPSKTSYFSVTELFADHPLISTRLDRIYQYAASLIEKK